MVHAVRRTIYIKTLLIVEIGGRTAKRGSSEMPTCYYSIGDGSSGSIPDAAGL